MKNVFYIMLPIFLAASSIPVPSLAGKDRNEDRQLEPDPRDSKKAKSEQDESGFFEFLPLLEEGFDALHGAVVLEEGFDALHGAAVLDDALAVSPLLEGDLILAGTTYLPVAPENGQNEVEALRILLANGFFDDYDRADAVTPLEYAARFGQVEALQMLLADDRFVGGEFDEGYPMLEAIKHGHIDVLRILLADGRFNYDCEAPLDVAARYGQVGALRILLADGRFIRLGDPIHDAIYYGQVQVLRILLADGRFDDFYFSSISKMDNAMPLYNAAYHNQLDALRILLADGRFNNKLDPTYTPLHLAARQGHENIVRTLIWHFPRPEHLIGDNDRAILAGEPGIRTDIAQMIRNWERPVWNPAYLVVYPQLLRNALFNWFLVLHRLRMIFPPFRNALIAVPTYIVVDFYTDQEGWNPNNQRNTERRLAEMRLIENTRARDEQDRNNAVDGGLVNPQVDHGDIAEVTEDIQPQLVPALTGAPPVMMAAALAIFFAHGKQPPL